MDGYCACGVDNHYTSCDEVCDNHILSINGWTEITPDNVDEVDAIDPNRVVIATMIEGIVFSSVRADSDITLKSCSELGGYYYYVLPELKIE
jgi:hypothetical protein